MKNGQVEIEDLDKAIKEERLAFADWLERWNAEWYELDPNIEELEKEMEAKIKELRSKPFGKSLEGKDK